jgi:hypothetical protein
MPNQKAPNVLITVYVTSFNSHCDSHDDIPGLLAEDRRNLFPRLSKLQMWTYRGRMGTPSINKTKRTQAERLLSSTTLLLMHATLS